MTADIRIRKRTLFVSVALLGLLLLALLQTNEPERCVKEQSEQEQPLVYSVVSSRTDAPRGFEEVDAPCPRNRNPQQDNEDLPTIYAITPTYSRFVQKADLTRLSQTLMWLDNFHWIVVEDSEEKTSLVDKFLKQTSLHYTHLAARTIKDKQIKPSEPHWMKARGVEQRNAGLDWLRKNLKTEDQLNGVVYFMDDDNTYSLKVFDEMRKVHKVGVWPVGLVGGMMVERPIVNATGKNVIGFNSVWRPERPFPIDMAGFAIHLRLIVKHPNAVFTHKVQAGYQESEILRQLITREELEPLADKCTRVHVWHTRTEKPKMNEENKLRAKNPKGSNDGIEV